MLSLLLGAACLIIDTGLIVLLLGLFAQDNLTSQLLGRRSAVEVELDVRREQRLPDRVEVAAYYAVAEALTNASKHSGATRAWVSVRKQDGSLQLSVRDDGAGGADPTQGRG